MSRPEFNAEEIRELLGELGRRLEAEGIAADIKLVGGAAIIFAGSDRRTTADIDASYAHPQDVNRIAAGMAVDYGLPDGWLNDNAAAHIPENAQWIEVQIGQVRLQRATDETLLAMKMAAERDRDIPDLGFLADKLGLDSPEKMVSTAFRMYGEMSLSLTAGRENYLIVAEEALTAWPSLREAIAKAREKKPDAG